MRSIISAFFLLLTACAPQASQQSIAHPPPGNVLTGTLGEYSAPIPGESATFKVTGRAVDRSGIISVQKTPNGGMGWFVSEVVVDWSTKVDNCGDHTDGIALFWGQNLYIEADGFEIRAQFNIVTGEFSGEIRSPCMTRSASVQLRSVTL